MIEINLLPGAGKKARGKAGGPDVGSKVAAGLSQLKEPYLILCVVSLALSAGVIGVMYTQQKAKSEELTATEQKNVQDSTRYAAVLREKKKAESQRDSVMHQLNIIKTIDNNRFVWPHVMDEISRAMPAYTWLTALDQTSAVTVVGSVDTTVKKSKKARAEMEDEPAPKLAFKITGNTVDIQALTRFMKLLEASPFIQNVQLEKSDMAVVDGKDLTEFSLTAEYQTPDSTAIRTIPLTLSVR